MSLNRMLAWFSLAFAFNAPSFSMRHGANPKATNGGGRSGAAASKRASRKRRNVRLHPRGGCLMAILFMVIALCVGFVLGALAMFLMVAWAFSG